MTAVVQVVLVVVVMKAIVQIVAFDAVAIVALYLAVPVASVVLFVVKFVALSSEVVGFVKTLVVVLESNLVDKFVGFFFTLWLKKNVCERIICSPF